MPITELDLETCPRWASKSMLRNAFISLKHQFPSSETHFAGNVSQHKVQFSQTYSLGLCNSDEAAEVGARVALLTWGGFGGVRTRLQWYIWQSSTQRLWMNDLRVVWHRQQCTGRQKHAGCRGSPDPECGGWMSAVLTGYVGSGWEICVLASGGHLYSATSKCTAVSWVCSARFISLHFPEFLGTVAHRLG